MRGGKSSLFFCLLDRKMTQVSDGEKKDDGRPD